MPGKLVDDVVAVLGHIPAPSHSVALVTCDAAPALKLLKLVIDVVAQCDEMNSVKRDAH